MSDEVEIQIVEPGSEDDPFAPQRDPLASAAASEEDAEEDEDEAGSDSQQQVTNADDDADDEGYTPAELVALEELATWQREQAEAAAEASVSKLQSKYDRQLAAQQRQMRELTEAAQAREAELQTAIREAKLNGLSDVEKEQLKRNWDEEDRVAKLTAYESQLTDFHLELSRTAFITEFADFGLQEGDLDQFSTVEEMEDFVKDVQIEYFKLMADPRVRAAIAAEEAAPATPAPSTPARKAPAGATAPTDAGGGSAPAAAPKFNKEQGIAAMADNIRGGWETTRVR